MVQVSSLYNIVFTNYNSCSKNSFLLKLDFGMAPSLPYTKARINPAICSHSI